MRQAARSLGRTRAVALAFLGVTGLVAARAASWPEAPPEPPCAAGALRLDELGAVGCGPGEALPAGQALTLGGKVDLATATAEELALVPGVSATLARRLVEARRARGGFASWEQVDQVEGVGPATLARLQARCELATPDSGV